MRNVRPTTMPFNRYTWQKGLQLLAALVFMASPLSARSDENKITGLRVIAETSEQLTLEVQYSYSGEYGPKAFASVVMSNEGEASSHYAYRPGTVRRGTGRSQVALSLNASAPGMFMTNALIASLYAGGQSAFVQQVFTFPKTWTRPGYVLRPSSPSSVATQQGEVKRQVLPDGTVQLRGQDGTVVRRTKSGQTIIRPDGTTSSMMHANAQSPSPPSGAPDNVLSAWLNSEADKLLYIMRTLTGNDSGSIANYLQKEGSDTSPYRKVTSRTDVISLMIPPIPGS